MRYYQKGTVSEHNFGDQVVQFVVTDSYSELWQEGGTATNIFELDKVSKDLNVEEGSFAVDELQFSINELACRTESDLAALQFCRDAADLANKRYVAVIFSNTPSIDDALLFGMIISTIKGEDKVWNPTLYTSDIKPKREYKFSALTFDIAMLDQCKMTDKIISSDGSVIPNVYDRFQEDLAPELGPYYHLEDLFENKVCYETSTGTDVYTTPIGNLYKVLQQYLINCSGIIHQLSNSSVTFVLKEGSLGVKTAPISVTLYPEPTNLLKMLRNIDATQSPVEIKLSYTDTGAGWSVPFITRKMIDPYWGIDDEINKQKELASISVAYSFKSYDDVTELLYDIARAFGCYIFMTFTAQNVVELEFKPRSQIVESDYTYLIGANKADVNTSSLLTDKPNQYYAVQNKFTSEDIDSYKVNLDNEYLQSAGAEAKLDSIQRSEEKKNMKFDRLALSFSSTICSIKTFQKYTESHQKLYYYANHLSNTVTKLPSGAITTPSYLNEGIGGDGRVEEMLNTGILVACSPPTSDVNTTPLATTVWLPTTGALARINGEDREFDTLSDYINDIMTRDTQYYETEYNITVPFWNGFSKNANGSNSSWKDIKLGSKIRLGEEISGQMIYRDYVVVGIEISLSKPETKLKLHNTSRFAYGTWDGDPGAITGSFVAPETTNFIDDSEVEEIEAGAEVDALQAVMVNSAGQIVEAVNHSDYNHKTIGIAISSGVSGDLIKVKTGGIVTFPDNTFSNISKQAFVRTGTSTNISETILETATTEENMIIVLGTIIAHNKLKIDIREFIYG